VPIVKKEADREAVSAAVAGLEGALKAAGVRVRVDAGTEKTPGWKFNFWEMKVRGNPAWGSLTVDIWLTSRTICWRTVCLVFSVASSDRPLDKIV